MLWVREGSTSRTLIQYFFTPRDPFTLQSLHRTTNYHNSYNVWALKPLCILTSHEQCSVAEALLQCNPCNLFILCSVMCEKFKRVAQQMATMTLRSVFRKQIFQFVAWQICIAHDWLSKNKLFLLCKSSKSHVLRSERLIHLFHLWNWPRCKLEQCKQIQTKNLKTFGGAMSCIIAGQNLMSPEICLTR